MLDSLRAELGEQGIVMGIARVRGLFRTMLERAGVAEKFGQENLFPALHGGAKSFQQNSHGVAKAQTS